MKTFLKFLLAMGLVVLMAAPSLAGLAVDFTPTLANDGTVDSFSLGFQFTTTSAINVTALGYYDDLLNGLTQSHDVGIYNSSGTLLVSTTVVNSDPLTSWFRMHSIAPTLLAAGQTYYIMGVTGAENYTFDPTGFAVDPSITFVADVFNNVPSAVLAFPNDTAGVTGWFGPNFATSAVPVPPTVLLLGSGLLGLVGLRRFRKG